MKATAFYGKKCFLFHNWKRKAVSSITTYHECRDCNGRMILQPDNLVYQPVDWNFLVKTENEISSPI